MHGRLRRGSRPRLGRGAERRDGGPRLRPARGRCCDLLRVVRRHAAHRDRLLPRRNQSAHGTDKVNGIVNAHLATGRIGRPGMGPFSLTGQPNAMGGREVGGLANQLAAHMDFEPQAVERVARFWNAPRMAAPGAQGRRDVRGGRGPARQGALDHGDQPGCQPAECRPRARRPACLRLRRGVRLHTRYRYRDLRSRAPARGRLGEKDGTVTNSERRISRQGVSPAGRWGAARLVDHHGSRPVHGFRCGFSVHEAAKSSANMRPCPPSRTAARASSTSGASPGSRTRNTTRSSRSMARDSRGSGRDGAPPRRWPISDREWMRPLRCRPPGRAGPRRLGRAAPGPEHRAPARPMAHHDPHGPCPATRPTRRSPWSTSIRDAASKGIHAGDLVRIASRWGGAVVRARLAAACAARHSCRCIGVTGSPRTARPAGSPTPPWTPGPGSRN